MIEFGGIYYYLDLDALDKAITSKANDPKDLVTLFEKKQIISEDGKTSVETKETSSVRGKELDGHKYELIRFMLETIIDNDDDIDSDASLGVDRALEKAKLSYKIAFNTLYNYGILKEKE